MRTLCFGGSFNPVHHGHLICARIAAEHGRFDRVLLIPSGQPPHKPEFMDMAPSAHRLAMCRAAVREDALFEVDDLEIRRGGPSYTIDTVRQLRARGLPDVVWLIGADMALSLPSWHQSVTLISEAKFLVLARPGSSLDATTLPPEYRIAAQNIVPAPLIDISSSDIRRRVAAGRSINYLTPPPVVDYIREHALYQQEK